MQPLTVEELALTESLPKKYPSVSLQGIRVKIEPLDISRDSEVLYSRTNGSSQSLGSKVISEYDADELIWRYMFGGPFETIDKFIEFITKLDSLPDHTMFTIFDIETNSQIGFFAMMNNLPEHLKVEIGHIVISPVAQNKGVCTEMTFLMLNHAFGIGYQRLEWKCNNLNERSKITALATGFTFEGVQKYHMIIKRRNRDTAWFRIVKNEWNDVKLKLEEKIHRVR